MSARVDTVMVVVDIQPPAWRHPAGGTSLRLRAGSLTSHAPGLARSELRC